jgi:hypothetical protein
MTDGPGQPQDELVEALDQLVALLRRYEIKHWADWFARDRQLIASGDAYGATHILSAYGGMGSINDLMILPENGHPIARADVKDVNESLMQLSGRVSALARRIQRSV